MKSINPKVIERSKTGEIGKDRKKDGRKTIKEKKQEKQIAYHCSLNWSTTALASNSMMPLPNVPIPPNKADKIRIERAPYFAFVTKKQTVMRVMYKMSRVVVCGCTMCVFVEH